MGRRQSNRHSHRSQPVQGTARGLERLEPLASDNHQRRQPEPREAASEPREAASESREAASESREAHVGSVTSGLRDHEYERRWQELVAKEADLKARRREMAREIRRVRRETPRFDARLIDIEMLIAELAQAVLQLGQSNREHDTAVAEEATHAVEAAAEQASADEAMLCDLKGEIDALREEIESLTIQNHHLAGELAQSNIKRSIGSSAEVDATLTWEQRKALLFNQDLDASATHGSSTSAEEFDEQLNRVQDQLRERDREIAELRDLLEQRPLHREEGTAVGAAAIALMMDGDELICEERKRLQELQSEWEAKFRDMEINASIERANLARERQQLERQNAELEEQLAHLQRELKQEEIAGPNQSRRWLAKLGLAD
jgi:hypothetical protein